MSQSIRRLLIPIALGLLGVPALAQAQDPAERVLIAAFRDSVAAIPTLKAVDSVDHKWASKQSGGMNELRRGILEWHRGRLSGDAEHYEKAVAQFERATRRARDWPYPWYLLGRTRMEMLTHAFRVRGVTQQRGAAYRRFYMEGLRNIEQGLERDPAFPPALAFKDQQRLWLAWLAEEDVGAQLDNAEPEGVRVILANAPATGPSWTRPRLVAANQDQAPEARRALEALLDTLARVTTAAAIPNPADPWDPAVTPSDSVWLVLRRAFITHRAAELVEDTAAFKRARDTFRHARDLSPSLPYGWYGDGISQLGLRRLAMRGDAREPEAGYEQYYVPGLESLERSLQVDPGFRPTLELVLAMAAAEADRTHLPWIVDAVTRLSRIDSTPDPEAFLVIARSHRQEGELGEAAAALDHYLRVGGDASVAALEQARTLAADSAVGMARHRYLEGLATLSAAGRRHYRRDLMWVAEPAELTALDGLPLDSVPDWIRWFWTKRDAEAVRPEGTRLREHFRRWALVNRDFRAVDPMFRAPLNPPFIQDFLPCATDRDRMTLDDLGHDTPTHPDDLRGWEPIYDHRAAVYMRHGPPVGRVWQFIGSADALGKVGAPGANPQTIGSLGADISQTVPSPRGGDGGQEGVGPGLPPTGDAAALLADADYTYRETWSYFFDGRVRLVTFRGSQALGQGATTLVPVLPLDGTYLDEVVRLGNPYGQDFARAHHDAIVRREARLAGVPSGRAVPSTRCTMAGGRVEAVAEEDFRTAATTDSHTLLFPADLNPGAVAFGMPAVAGGATGTVLGVFSVPLRELTADTAADGSLSTALRVRVTAVDRATRRTTSHDTLRTFALRPGGSRSGTLSGMVELPAAPGHYAIRVAVQRPDSSAGNAIEIPQAVDVWRPGEALRLSDLVTGGDAGNLLWRYGGESVSVHPATAFRRGTTIELFYVQGGLRPGSTYESSLTLTKAGSESPALSVRFEEPARLALETKRRGLDLQDVGAGEYDMILTIRELGSDRQVRRERRITVAD